MACSYFLAHLVRYEDLSFLQNAETFFYSLLIVTASRGVIFLFSDIYRSLWAYASIHDLV
jgi:FlaA1/EpsC-like NDP-sugar epimerase